MLSVVFVESVDSLLSQNKVLESIILKGQEVTGVIEFLYCDQRLTRDRKHKMLKLGLVDQSSIHLIDVESVIWHPLGFVVSDTSSLKNIASSY